MPQSLTEGAPAPHFRLPRDGGGTVTPDGLFSAIEFECLGSCTTAPVMQVNGEFYENLDVEKTESIIDDFRRRK